MNDAEKLQAIGHVLAVLDRHQNDDDGGARPFNETGEAVEVIRCIVDGTGHPDIERWMEEPA